MSCAHVKYARVQFGNASRLWTLTHTRVYTYRESNVCLRFQGLLFPLPGKRVTRTDGRAVENDAHGPRSESTT